MARKIIGITFIVAAIIGLIFSLAGVIIVWAVKEPVTQNMLSTIDLVNTTLETTKQGLTIADNTLTQAITDLSTLESTIQTANNTLEASVPIVGDLADLTSESLPDAIESTQFGLQAVRDAGRTLESTMRLLTSLPFIPLEDYDPDVSFVNAVEGVSSSLEPIPDALLALEDTLNTTQGNLALITDQVSIISGNIGDLMNSLHKFQVIIGQYQDVVSTLQNRVGTFRANLSTIINVSVWLFTIIFIWLGIAQLGLLSQGLERVDWPAKQNEENDDPQPDVVDDQEIKDRSLNDDDPNNKDQI